MLLYSSLGFGQGSNNELLIKEVKNSYNTADTIIFIVQNNFDKKLFASIGVELHLNNEWFTITNDIYKVSFTKNRSICSLQANSTLEQFWIPSNTPRIVLNENSATHLKSRYRFFVDYGDIPSSLKTKIYSNEFIIQ
jgi:hypothetical protein